MVHRTSISGLVPHYTLMSPMQKTRLGRGCQWKDLRSAP